MTPRCRTCGCMEQTRMRGDPYTHCHCCHTALTKRRWISVLERLPRTCKRWCPLRKEGTQAALKLEGFSKTTSKQRRNTP